MTIKPEVVRAAALILKVTESEALSYSAEIPEHQLARFWRPTRGGAAIIIGNDLSYLRVGSGTGPTAALAAYLSGTRTEE